MKRNYLFVVMMVWSILSSAILYATEPVFNGGSGTETEPYLIAEPEHMLELSTLVNDEGNSFEGKYFKVTKTVNYTLRGGFVHIPIGTPENPFQGTFDGDSKTLWGMNVAAVSDYAGIFGYVGEKGVLKNIYIAASGNPTMNGKSYLGTIVGYCAGKVEYCYSYSPLTSVDPEATYIGGMVGYAAPTCEIVESYFCGSITAAGSYIGGIVGYHAGNILDQCMNVGHITATGSGNLFVGGIAGATHASISNCYNVSMLDTEGNYIGGIAGQTLGEASITACYNAGQCFGQSYIGSILGNHESSGTITYCHYDKQIVPLEGVNGTNTEGISGLLTKEMTVATPFEGFDPSLWLFEAPAENAYYPRLARFVLSSPARTSIAAIWLYADEYRYDTSEEVTNDFSVSYYPTYVKWYTEDAEIIELIVSSTNGEAVVYPDQDEELTTTLRCEYSNTRKYVRLTLAAGIIDRGEAFGGGTGNQDDPYLIETYEHLKELADKVNSGYPYKNRYFKLMDTIDFQGAEGNPITWSCIGYSASSSFDGIFDGNEKVFRNFYFSTEAEDQGIFGFTGESAIIRNLYVDGYSRIEGLHADPGSNTLGTIVGNNRGIIENCHVVADITGKTGLGGITGTNAGAIRNCTYTGEIYGQNTLGGIAGTNSEKGIIESCINYGTIRGFDSVAGIVGYNPGTVTTSYNTGMIVGDPNTKVSTGTMSSGRVGGVVGYSYRGAMSQCFNTGYVLNGVEGGMIGGICGRSYESTISDCYNTGTLACVNTALYAGGIAGESVEGGIENSYNVGQLQATHQDEIVMRYDESTVIRNTYFDKQIAASPETVGSGMFTSKMVSGEAIEGFSPAIWDFTEGLYPRIKGIEDNVYAILGAATPVLYTNEEGSVYDIFSIVANDMKVYTTNGVVWSIDENEYVKLEGNSFRVTRPEREDETITLRATAEGFSKSMEFTIMAQIEGSGFEHDPWQIESVERMHYLASKVNSGQPYTDRYFLVMNDINMGGTTNPFTPIGGNGSGTNRFRGTFDGGNHHISNLYINSGDKAYVGLIGYLNYDGLVKNVRITGDSKVVGSGYTGAIVGENYGTIENCYNYADVHANNFVGGIAGWSGSTYNYKLEVIATNTIRNCFNAGNVSSNTNLAGGISCSNYGLIENCLNVGKVTGTGHSIGGISATNSGTIINCLNAGLIDNKDNYYVGGITGIVRNGATVENSISIGTCIGNGSILGGITEGGSAINCYFDTQFSPLPGIGTDDEEATNGEEGNEGIAAENNIDDSTVYGLLTNEMVSANGFEGFDTAIWTFNANMYPTLNTFYEMEHAKLATVPVFLHSEEELYDTYDTVNHSFTVGRMHDVSWESSSSVIVIEEANATIFPLSKEDHTCTLIAKLGEASRTINLTVIANPDQIKDKTDRNTPSIYTTNHSIMVEVSELSQIMVYDLSGKLIEQTVVNGFISIPLNESGIYVVKVKSDNYSLTDKALIR